jgi:hypothetical protein
MASKTLYAPLVAATQPAFIYEGEEKTAKVYIDIFTYNTINEIGGILFTLTDPNIVSTWSSNSLIKESEVAKIGILWYSFNIVNTIIESSSLEDDTIYCIKGSDEKYYIQEGLSSFEAGVTYYKIENLYKDKNGYYFKIYLGQEDTFKTLTVNTYYSLQIQTYGKDVGEIETIDNTWLMTNENKISEKSQVTLIRPILKPVITINGFKGEGIWEVYDVSALEGSISYSNGNDIEGLDNFYYEISKIKDNSQSPIVETTVNFRTQNFYGNGLSFKIPLEEVFYPNCNYVGKLCFTTIHGYFEEFNFEIKILEPISFDENEENPKIGLVHGNNAISALEVVYSNAALNDFIERASEKDGFKNWSRIKTILITDDCNRTAENPFQDFMIEDDVIYQYRIARIGSDFVKYVSNSSEIKDDQNNEIKTYIDDISIADNSFLLLLKYNPNISGYKYVTQEAIVTPLGGKFPIVRRSGESNYRQFSLSCSLYLDDLLAEIESRDSRNNNMNTWFSISDTALYLAEELKGNLSYIKTKRNLESKVRQYIIEKLSKSGPKLFRSAEEGNMIVYLSNLSFTPNKGLGRLVYDMSCTVTEIADCTFENLKKYNLEVKSGKSYLPFSNFVLKDSKDSASVFYDKSFEIH